MVYCQGTTSTFTQQNFQVQLAKQIGARSKVRIIHCFLPICILPGLTTKATVHLSTSAVIKPRAAAVIGVPILTSVRKRDRITVDSPSGDEQHPWELAVLIDGLARVARSACRPTNGSSGGIEYGYIEGIGICCWVWLLVLSNVYAAPSWGVPGGNHRISIGRWAARFMTGRVW